MILNTLQVDPNEFERRSGWTLKPEGLCKGDRCVPLPFAAGEPFAVRALAERLGMPLIYDEANGLWCLGPEAGSHTLTSAQAPELTLPELNGNPFSLSSLRGRKVLLVAWASW